MMHHDLANTLRASLDDPNASVEDRRHTLEGLASLASGDLKAATAAFRRAQHRDAAPFDAVAAVALAECLRAEGREGAAVKTWREAIDNPTTPDAVRYAAWLGLAALYASRQDDQGVRQAQAALDALSHIAP